MYEQPFNPYAQNLAVVKEYFRSGKVLAMGIFKAIATVLALIASILSINSLSAFISAYINQITASSGIPMDNAQSIISSAQASMTASTIASAAVAVIIGVLITVAYIILYTKSRSDSPDSSPKAGVMILYVLAVIELVASIVLTVLMALLAVVLIWLAVITRGTFDTTPVDLGNGASFDLTPGFAVAIFISSAVLLLIAAIIMLIVTINKKRYFGSIKNSITTVELRTEGAKPYGVLCVIGAVFSGLGLLSIPTTLLGGSVLSATGIPGTGGLSATTLVSALSSIVSFIILILGAAIALGYKKFIDDRKYGYSAPPVMSAPYGAQPQNAQPGNTNPYADSFTQTPQNEATAAPVCPACGAPADPNAPFCSNCGNRLK